jgi:hypothetical protein
MSGRNAQRKLGTTRGSPSITVALLVKF